MSQRERFSFQSSLGFFRDVGDLWIGVLLGKNSQPFRKRGIIEEEIILTGEER